MVLSIQTDEYNEDKLFKKSAGYYNVAVFPYDEIEVRHLFIRNEDLCIFFRLFQIKYNKEVYFLEKIYIQQLKI